MKSTRASEQVKMEEDAKSYEEERMANIKQNAALLESLGLNTVPAVRPPEPKAEAKPALSADEKRAQREAALKKAAAKLKRQAEPTRRSSRVASRGAVRGVCPGKIPPSDSPPPRSWTTEELLALRDKQRKIPKGVSRVIPPESDDEAVDERKRAPRPCRGLDGRLIFEGRWNGVFTPNVTPEEMFAGGAFAGGFFRDTYSTVLDEPLLAEEDMAELPFEVPEPELRLYNPNPDPKLNRFKVRAGQTLRVWEKSGWIWEEDPRGWAQWYLRFWNGRRCEDDERQIKRWLKFAGPTGRFKMALMRELFHAGGIDGVENEDAGRVLRQCLWQWGYELNKEEYQHAMKGE